MSSDSTNDGEVPHYAYLLLTYFPPFPTEIAVLCHYVKTNYIILPCGHVGPSPFTRVNKVELFLVETLVLQIRFRLPSYFSSTMVPYWEQTFTENYHGIKYSLYSADVSFRDSVDSFRNVGGA
jgi:hypothetical protein